MHAHTKHEEHDPKFSQLVRQMNVRDNTGGIGTNNDTRNQITNEWGKA